MTINEINKHLFSRNTVLDSQIKSELERLKAQAVAVEDEKTANELWCYEQIYLIQNEYYKSYKHMHRAFNLSEELDENGYDSPKSKEYEAAWNALDHSDMKISFLAENYCIEGTEIEKFHINEIEEDIQRLLPLFPYRFFISREQIIKREECSICGKTISIRHPCGHVAQRLYMGEMCCKKVVDLEFLGASIVTKPFDRYAIMKPHGIKFNFSLLDFIVPKIKPYSKWSYDIEKRLLPEFQKIGRNARCPCGSGKKFKYCIRDHTERHFKDHFIFSVG